MELWADEARLIRINAALTSADNQEVTMTISPPIRVFAFLGALVATALGLFFFIASRSDDTRGATLTTAQHPRPAKTERPGAQTPATHTPKPPATTRFQTPRSGFPTAVDRAFRQHRVVVLVVYMPGAAVDAIVRKEARAGAIAAGAGYVPVSALNKPRATQVVAKTGVLPDPAIVILRRPGIVTTTLGVTDRETVAQAVVQARK
jgi:hypothetical protein